MSIKARWIIDKNDNVYKTKIKETIHMLILKHQILKAQKSLNHGEYCSHIKQFILTSPNSYCNFHILFMYQLSGSFWFRKRSIIGQLKVQAATAKNQ